MKIKSLIYTSLASVLLFASCDLNKEPIFNDASMAFIAFENVKGRVTESVNGEGQILAIPLYCASVHGISASVTYDVEADTTYARPAYENVNFAVVNKAGEPVVDRVINFSADHRFDTIYVKTIDDRDYINIGDRRFNVVLKSATNCNLGAENTFSVTIADDEDPVNVVAGSFVATAMSYAAGGGQQPAEISWDVEITRDDVNLNKVWIDNIFNGSLYGYSFNPIYAMVDTDLKNLTIRRGQVLNGSADESSYIILATAGDPMVEGGTFTATYKESAEGVTISFGSAQLAPYHPAESPLDRYPLDYVMSLVFTKK